MPKIKRALVSVYDKSGILEFAKTLKEFGVEIVSTGGTAAYLKENGIDTTSVSDITEFPEILGGRVKTLHPKIYGGLLGLRENSDQMQELIQHDIAPIDMVVVNLYPFEKIVSKPDVTRQEALESIDIGGPCMIRAAAKNYLSVAVVTSPGQYESMANELGETNGEVNTETTEKLAATAYALTSNYDRKISQYLTKRTDNAELPDTLNLNLSKVRGLRYGENPHQTAALYAESGQLSSGLLKAEQLHGKELSYNNLIDADAALGVVQEFDEPCVVIVKHTNPCGAAIGKSIKEAYLHAKGTDPVSAFGGIVGINRKVDAETARVISEIFTEVLIAPDFDEQALEILKQKKNLRVLKLAEFNKIEKAFQLKRIQGGMLLQDQDFKNISDIDFNVVSEREPTEEEWMALKFGWRICKWVKSNAIVYSTQDRTIGIGAGQMSRVDSSYFAVKKANEMQLNLEGTILASDAFFPFRDGVDVAAKAGATALIQPGGSVRDEEVIAAVNENKMAMVFTGVRHFRH